MKIIKSIVGLLVLAAFVAVLTWFFAPQYLKQIPLLSNYDIPAASELLKDAQDDSLIEHARKHSDPNYVCPMHPQIVKGEPGSCPICGMDLVKKEIETSAEHETVIEHARKHSDPNYVCPMHPQIVKGKPGSCPICGMDLVKKEVEASEEHVENNTLIEHARKHSDPNYVCPMHPQIVKGEPGTCPICGMDLVKKEPVNTTKSSQKDDLPKVRIKANTAQNMGIRTATVTTNELSRTIHTIGTINYNEDSLHHIHPRASGWVEKVHVKAEGDQVERGHPLVEFYSPEIVAAEKDLIIAKQSGKLFSQKGTVSLLESAKQKLRLLDVPERIIDKVNRTGQSQDRIPILAPQHGVIIQMGIRDGMYVTPETQMYLIADLSSVWVLVDVFEHQLNWVKVGNEADMQVQGLPGESWMGKVDYIYPELNPVNRTLKVRLKFTTPNQKLKPNMFANVTLYSNAKSVLSVPTEAIIYYENSARVVKVIGKHQYKPVKIKTGMKSEGRVEILEGLEEDDKIVVSGQFMLDSESNLQASFRRMME